MSSCVLCVCVTLDVYLDMCWCICMLTLPQTLGTSLKYFLLFLLSSLSSPLSLSPFSLSFLSFFLSFHSSFFPFLFLSNTYTYTPGLRFPFCRNYLKTYEYNFEKKKKRCENISQKEKRWQFSKIILKTL